jgi:hypothetical protein
MTKTKTEMLSGLGKLFDKQQFIKDVRYGVRIFHRFHEVDTLDGVCVTPISDDAHIGISPAQVTSPYRGKLLTLQMTDGRKWDFYVSLAGGGLGWGGPYQTPSGLTRDV